MKRLSMSFVLAFLIIVCPVTFYADDRIGSHETEADLLKLQHEYFDAIMARNYDSAIGLLADNYVGFHADVIVDRAREAKDLKEFPLTAREMSQ